MIRIFSLGTKMRQYLESESRNVARAVTIGITAAAEGAKLELRRSVSSYAGSFGKGRMGRVANAIRAETYPRPPKYSPAAAAHVFAQGEQAERIFVAFSTGPYITPKAGRPTFTGKGRPALAIPLHQFRDINGDLLGPRSSYWGGRLVFIPARDRSGSGVGVLALPAGGRKSQIRRQRNTVNRRSLSRQIDQKMVPMFALVRAVRHPKLMDPQAVGAKWAAAAPGLVQQALARI